MDLDGRSSMMGSVKSADDPLRPLVPTPGPSDSLRDCVAVAVDPPWPLDAAPLTGLALAGIMAKKFSLGSELCEALGIEAGSAMTRGELERALDEYGSEQSLKDGRFLLIDSALARLLWQPEGFPVPLFQLVGMLKAAGKIEQL